MLESLVATILNRSLGSYVSNLNYDQLNIGVWKGEANLRDLKLRREALDKLNLPIDVVEGYLGELKLIIPWSNLKTKPVKIYIDNVYLLAVPKNEATLSLDEEEKRAQQLKVRRLATAELLSTKLSDQQQSKESSDDGFISQLTTKVIDNLQVSIKNIHIRFEDNISDPDHPYAAGITLKELSAASTDGQWNPTFINEMTNTIHKLVTLQSISVYWNTDSESLAGLTHDAAAKAYADLIPDGDGSGQKHQYILKPVSGTGKVMLNKQFGGDTPKTDVTLLFDDLGICLDDHQYRDALLLVDLFHVNLKKQKYLRFHPSSDVTPKKDPRAYWKFAIDAVMSEVHEKNYQWSWDHFRIRRDQRREYIECYVASKTNKATPEQKEKLDELERILTFEDIRFYRSLAKSKLKHEKIKIDQEKKKENQNKGWFSSWWSGSGGSDSNAESEETDDNSIQITEEQKRELYDAIEYDEDKAAAAAAVDMPKDTVKLNISTKLQKGSVSLMKYTGQRSRNDLVSLVFDTVTVDVTQFIESSRIGLGLMDLRLYDSMTPNTLYPQMIGVRKVDNTRKSIIEAVGGISLHSQKDAVRPHAPEDEPLFSVIFDHKPFNKSADNAIQLKTRRLEVVFNPNVIKGVLQFLKPPKSKSESINALLEAAGDTFEGFRQQTMAGLEYALNQHRTLALDVDMDAPIIIVPESCTERHTPCMIIDAGHIRVDSDLANQEIAKEFKNKKLSKADYTRLENLMYDKFNVRLSQTKLLIGADVQECLEREKRGVIDQSYLVQRIDMDFVVELCILQRVSQFTKFKVSGHLPLLSANISDKKYKVLMKMIDVVLDSVSDENDQMSTVEDTDRNLAAGVTTQSPQKSLFVPQWNQHDDLLISDTGSESSAEPYWTAQQRNTSGDNTSTDPSVNTVSAYPRRDRTYQQEQFRFSFIVDKVSATVYEAQAGGDEKLLCELVLENFDLDFVSRPLDMEVNVSLEALNILDKMDHGNEFKYLVTSRKIGDTGQPEKNLVNVRYLQAKRSHPLYQEVYHGFDQTVDIGLSTLNIVITRSSLLKLYSFVLNTFTSPPSSAEEHRATHIPGENAESMPIIASTNTIKVNVHMDELSLILNNDGKRLGTCVLSSGDVAVHLYPATLNINGRFSNFTLTDDTVLSSHGEHIGASDVYMLSIEGEELLDFTFETFDPKASEFPGYNSKFYLLMGALQFKLLDSAKPTLDFLSEFLEMKSVYDAARQAAVQQIQETNTRMHFDVTVRSPVVIFPVGDQGETVTAHLGEIRATNEFTVVSRRKSGDVSANPIELSVSRIKCGLYNIGLRSHSIVRKKNDASCKRTLPIIDNLNIAVEIESPEKPAPEYGPATTITGNISDIRMSLTETQYKWLLSIYGRVMTTFLGGSGETGTNDDDSISIDGSERPSSSSSGQPQREEELVSVHHQEKRSIQLALTMSLNMVCLDIIAGLDVDVEEWDRQRIARLAFNETSLSMQTMSDASMLLEAEMRYITFTDTRADSNSLFREIMSPSITGGPQLQVQLKMPAKNDEQQIMNIEATVDSPKLILSLDYVFLLVNFFTKPFTPTKTTEAQAFAKSQRERLLGEQQQQPAYLMSSQGRENELQPKGRNESQHQHQQHQQDDTSKLYFNINIVDVQIVCLARPETKSSEAVILSFNQLTVQQKESLTCRLDGVGMVLCRMDMREESAIAFVEEFGVDFAMKTSYTMPKFIVTDITIDVQPLVIRISYQDLMIVIDIINKAIALMGNDNASNALGAQGFDDGSMNDYLSIQPERYLVPNSPGQTSATTAGSTNQIQKIEPYIVMSKESLKAKFQGLQFILIEDLHDLPFIDAVLQPFTVNTRDWSSSLSLDIFFKASASSFNFRNSHWEPMIESWSFGVKGSQDSATKAMNISIESKDSLYVDVTHAFVETMFTVSGTLMKSQEGLPESAQKQVRPYIIRNQTGHDLRFWNMSDDAGYGEPDTDMFTLKNGQEESWSFRDWKRRRAVSNPGKNMLGVQVEAFDWESIQHVVLDKEGAHVYRMQPDVNGVTHRLIMDIKLKDHVKQVTFKSGLAVQNQTTERAEVVLMDSKGQLISDVWTVDPDEELSVPIEKVYNSWLALRPEGAYEWSQPHLHWSDITHPKGPRLLTCIPNEGNEAKHFYQINGVFNKLDPMAQQYPNMTVQFGAPIEVKNMLPFNIDFMIDDKTVGKLFSGEINKGKTEFVHSIDSSNHIALSIHVKGTRYQPSQPVDIKLGSEDEKSALQPIHMTTEKGDEPLDLLLSVARLHRTSKALWISIFAPYLVLNKTGFPIMLKSRFTYRQSKHVAYNIDSFENSDKVVPYMFSFPQIDKRNRVELSVNGSKLSDPLSFEAVGSVQDTSLRATQSAHDMHIGIHVEEGTGVYHLTKIVTIAPRYVLKNNLDVDIEFREFADNEVGGRISIAEKKPLFLLSRSNVRWLCLKREQQGGVWSSPFDLQQIGDIYVKLEDETKDQPMLIRISIVLSEASIFVFLEHEKRWPYEIINLSSVPVTFYQKCSINEEYKLSNREREALSAPRRFTLEPNARVAYSWCMAVGNEKQIVLDIYGKERIVNFQAIGTQTPIRYKKQERQSIGRNTSNGILALDVVAVDSALVLRLTDFDPETSLYRPKSSSASTAASSRDGSVRDTFETITINNVVNYSFELNLANIGISIVNKRVQEMAYATIRGLKINYTDSHQYQSIRAGIQWLQIDNQFHGSVYPILLYPTTLPKNTKDQQTPALHIALDKVKDDAYGVHNFRLFSILLQEMNFEMDEDFLYCLLKFFEFSELKQESATVPDEQLFKIDVPEPIVQKMPALYYFQEFCIQPMRLNISFVRTDHINAAEADVEAGRSPFQYAFDVFTMTIGNVNDAPIKLNALIVENMRVSGTDLTQRVILHYRDEVVYQMHKVLGSVDILGNPVGLFSNLSSGFGELFYEPYQGFIMSDRPQDLGIGIARGVGGFMKKGLFGVTDSMSRFTGSIGKGLSVATMDKTFQDRRRINQIRNKPKHAMYGLTQGATYFGTSVASAVSGLYKRPMEGIESGGVIGFAEGVGKGIVGVVTKPLVGIFDFASNVTAGVRETTNMFDSNDIGRERLPRYIGPDGIVRPFTQREALGQMWLKDMADGKYFNETYIAHCSTESDEAVILLSYQYLLVVATRKLEVEVSFVLDFIEEIRPTSNGFCIFYKSSNRPADIMIAEPTSRQWMIDQIESTLVQRKEEKERR